MKITLTLVERWMLWNQLELLKVSSPDDKQLQRAQEAIENGYEWEYEHCLPNLSHEPVSEDDCAEVREILDMYHSIQQALPNESAAQFPGFPDRETDQARYSRWVLKPGDEYEGLKVGPYPGVEQLPKYRRMLGVFKAASKPVSAEQAKALLAAGEGS